MPASFHMAKKRAPVCNVSNRKNVASSIASKTSPVPSSAALVHCTKKVAKANKGASACAITTRGNSGKILLAPLNVHSNPVAPLKVATTSLSDAVFPHVAVAVPASRSWDISTDETMSSSDSLKSSEVEYVENNDITALESSDRKTFKNLKISDDSEAGNVCSNNKDPQFCATYACDIYKHLCASEEKKLPALDYMERVQKDINPSMRAILIDWLVEVEEYRLVPDTLYLTVNYIDMHIFRKCRQRLQWLGVACMMITSKYEENCAPQVEEFCYMKRFPAIVEVALMTETDDQSRCWSYE